MRSWRKIGDVDDGASALKAYSWWGGMGPRLKRVETGERGKQEDSSWWEDRSQYIFPNSAVLRMFVRDCSRKSPGLLVMLSLPYWIPRSSLNYGMVATILGASQLSTIRTFHIIPSCRKPDKRKEPPDSRNSQWYHVCTGLNFQEEQRALIPWPSPRK